MTMQSGDIIRVTAKMRQNQQDVLNVYHMHANGTGDVADATVVTQVAARLDAAYQDINAQVTNNLTYGSIEVFNVTQDAPMGEVAWPTLTTGAGAGDPLPEATALNLLFPTQVARSQGRKFIGGMGEGASGTDGRPNSTVLNAAADFITTLLGAFLIGNGELEFGNWNDALSRFATWVSGFATDVWRTQRRRYRDSGS